MDDNLPRHVPENPNYIYGTDSDYTASSIDRPGYGDDVEDFPPVNMDPRMRPHFDFDPVNYRGRWRLSGPYPLVHQHDSWASEGTNTPEGGLHRSVGRYISDRNRRPRPSSPLSYDSSNPREPDVNAVSTDPADIPPMPRRWNAARRPQPPAPANDTRSDDSFQRSYREPDSDDEEGQRWYNNWMNAPYSEPGLTHGLGRVLFNRSGAGGSNDNVSGKSEIDIDHLPLDVFPSYPERHILRLPDDFQYTYAPFGS